MAAVHSFAVPDGVFSVINDGATVLAAGWAEDPEDILTHVHPSLLPERCTGPDAGSRELEALVRAYYDGDHAAPGRARVLQRSGEFRLQAWEALRQVGPGDVVSYSELASLAGRPTAVRAAASACSHNAVALFVPCHRVVRSDGSIGQFGFTPGLKQALLEREARA